MEAEYPTERHTSNGLFRRTGVCDRAAAVPKARWKLASYEVAGNTSDNLSRPEGTLEIRRAIQHGNISSQ